MPTTRRQFIKTGTVAGAAVVTALNSPRLARAAKPKVVVVGGGIAGGTAARYLAKDSKGGLDVTLVEPSTTYTTCFFSNWYLSGFRTLDQIQHGYGKLASNYGINMVHQLAIGLDASAKSVRLADGSALSYDRLVVAPGIDFRWGAIENYDEMAASIHPHAYKAGPQSVLLHDQLVAMKKGGTFLMVAPPNPYRCPPGPYERISLVAHYLKENNPTAKILILDSKDKFSKQGLFQAAWDKYYPGMVEWLPAEMNGGVERIDVAANTVYAGGDAYEADVLNIIPPQKAGNVADAFGLTNDSGWCPINNALDFTSAQVPDVHVLGDACINGAMPKSGFSANSQAKLVAMQIRHQLLDQPAFEPRLRNTCWSLVATDDAVKVGASYKVEADKTTSFDGFVSKNGEDSALRSQTRVEAEAWYNSIVADVFG